MPTTFSGNNLPIRATLWHDEIDVVIGNFLVFPPVVDTGQIHNFFTRQDPGGIGDTFTQSFFVRAGTYAFSALGQTNAANGKIDWYLDGTAFATGQDWYSAAQTKNVVKTASVTIANDGYHILKGAVSGKNGSSGGYNIDLTKYWLRQAAD